MSSAGKKPLMQGYLFCCVAAILVLLSASTHAVTFSTKQDIRMLIDQKMRIDGIPGVSFAVVQHGQLAWADAIGLANVEHATEAHAGTVYRSASIVKPLTATAILQLHQANKLDLDAPVWQYCAEFPEKPEVVTVRQLLTHTGGVRSYAMPWSRYEAELYSAKRYKSVTEALSIFAGDLLLHEPGSTYKYTSYGYNVLGCIIESITGTTYENHLEQYILKPSTMTSTLAERTEDIVRDRAGLYKRNSKGRLVNEKTVDLTNKIPSGGMLTTATDLARFAASYMSGSLLSDELMGQAIKPVTLSDGSLSYYGMGWDTNSVKPENRAREMYHVGVTPGVTGVLYLYPDAKGAVIIFANLYNVGGLEKLAQSIGATVGFDSTDATTNAQLQNAGGTH